MLRNYPLIFLATVTLAACEGGGGGQTTTPPPPSSVQLAMTPTSVVLDPGMSQAFSATGGEAPYTYAVATGVGSIDATSGVYTAGPAAGAATVQVSDHGGHSATAAVTVNSVLSLAPTPANVAIVSTLKLTPTGGTAPYSLALVSGGGSFDATANVYTAPATPGTATIGVTDSVGGKATLVVNINSGLVAASPTFMLTASSNQTYPIPVTGATTPLTYSMSSGTGTVDANGIYTAGTKVGHEVVQVTDANGVTTNVQIRLVDALTNGEVRSVISDSSGLYVGGYFSTVHPHVTSRMAALDLTSGKLNLRCDIELGFDAPANAMMLVGNSLYVGGSFTRYQGQPAHGLVKLDATTCALDQQFTQVSGFDGLANTASFVFPPIANVTTLVTDGTSLFAGGDFSSYRGLPAFGLAKLDLVTGNLDQTFTQATGFNDAVGPLAVSDDAVFVSGRYTAYRGSFTTANSLVLKLNKTTGAVEPAFYVPSTSGGIFSIAVSGTSVYIGGGIPGAISKLDATTGAVDTVFQNNLGSVQTRANILMLSGGSLYAGGNWTSLGGVPAGHIAKIDATTGKPDPTFNRANATDTAIYAMAATGQSVYVIGLSKYGDQSVPGFAKLNALTGDLDTSFGDGDYFGGGGASAVLASNDTLFLAGTMTTFGGIPAQNIAKFDPTTGVADSQFLSAGGPNRWVTKMLSNGASLYVAGAFSTYGGVNAPVLAKVDPTTGVADSLFSRDSGFQGVVGQDQNYLSNVVNALALSGNSLFVGGAFQYYRGLPVVALAKIDAVTGDLDTTFNQPVGFTATPGFPPYNTATATALAVAGNSVFVSGTFDGYRGTPRYIVAKLDASSGALDQQFAPYTQSQVVVPSSGVAFNALLPSGNSLYVGGEILGVPGSNQLLLNGVGKFDAITGAPDTTFMAAAGVYANQGISPMVFDLMLSGNSLYAGGDFSRNLAYTGSTLTSYTNNLVKFDATTGAVDTNFTRYGGPDYRVYSITQAGSSVRISGDFDAYRDTFSGYSMTVDPVSGDVL